MNEIASRYGLALFALAEDSKNVESLQAEVKVIRKIFKENHDFIIVLNSHFLSVEERMDILDKTLKGVSADIISLLKIMVKNGRISYLDEVLQAFNSYCNAYRGVDEGLIYSTAPLDEKTLNRIEEKISKVEKSNIELINRIDPELIGGVKVVINDHIYDGSIKNQLEMMKKDLLKKEKSL